MDIMRQVQDIFKGSGLGSAMGGMGGSGTGSLLNGFSSIFGNSGLLGPAALGGLLGALTGKGVSGMAGGALLAGGGAALWQKYKDSIQKQNVNNPQYSVNVQAADSSEQTERLVRALIYAAKADGHIDAREQQLIQEQIARLNLGSQGQTLVNQAINEPLDPSVIARGVRGADEALQIFTVSCAVLDIDQFMERAYLDQLAKALNIPDDVKEDLENKIHQRA